MRLITDYGLRTAAMDLMKSEDDDLTDRAMEDFKRTHAKKSIFLEQNKSYGCKNQLIVCGPLQRVPEQAVYTTDSLYDKDTSGNITRIKQRGSRRQLYIGDRIIVIQKAELPDYPGYSGCSLQGRIMNDAMVYIHDSLRFAESLKRVVIQDFARLCLIKRGAVDYGFFIYKTPEDKNLILGTLEEMLDEIRDIELERTKERQARGKAGGK